MFAFSSVVTWEINLSNLSSCCSVDESSFPSCSFAVLANGVAFFLAWKNGIMELSSSNLQLAVFDAVTAFLSTRRPTAAVNYNTFGLLFHPPLALMHEKRSSMWSCEYLKGSWGKVSICLAISMVDLMVITKPRMKVFLLCMMSSCPELDLRLSRYCAVVSNAFSQCGMLTFFNSCLNPFPWGFLELRVSNSLSTIVYKFDCCCTPFKFTCFQDFIKKLDSICNRWAKGLSSKADIQSCVFGTRCALWRSCWRAWVPHAAGLHVGGRGISIQSFLEISHGMTQEKPKNCELAWAYGKHLEWQKHHRQLIDGETWW